MAQVPDLTAWRGLSIVAPLHGGNRVTVFKAELCGSPVVLRRSTRSTDALEWEFDVLAHLRKTGIRVPEIVSTDDGQRHIEGWHLYHLIEGRTATDDDSDALREAIEHVHTATAGWAQRPGFLTAHDLLTEHRGGDIDLSSMPDELVARIRSAWAAVPTQPETVVHGDLGAGNAVIGPNGQVGLIDWDEARVDNPGFDIGTTPTWEVAQLAWEIATCWVTEPEYAVALVDHFLDIST